MKDSTVRVLVVDDSALYRKFVSSVLEEVRGVEVVGTAANGRIGLEKIESLQPDLITLDLEMPEMDGLTMLRNLADRTCKIPTIVISSQTAEAAELTNSALELGAFDFVLKPVGKGPNESRQLLRESMTPKIEASIASIRCKEANSTPKDEPRLAADPVLSSPDAVRRMVQSVETIRRSPTIVCLGVSTGGPAALHTLLPQLPSDFPCPILLVQHMPPMFTKSLADNLNRICALEIVEAEHGMVANQGQVLIAPGGKQMGIQRRNDLPIIQVSDDAPERNCKPSVNYLFRSVCEHYRDRAVAVMLTGMGDDGLIGCEQLKEAGSQIIAQDEASCVVYGMPRSVIEAGIVDRVVSLQEIATSLVQSVEQGMIA